MHSDNSLQCTDLTVTSTFYYKKVMLKMLEQDTLDDTSSTKWDCLI